jgi:hypothetical protein
MTILSEFDEKKLAFMGRSSGVTFGRPQFGSVVFTQSLSAVLPGAEFSAAFVTVSPLVLTETESRRSFSFPYRVDETIL